MHDVDFGCNANHHHRRHRRWQTTSPLKDASLANNRQDIADKSNQCVETSQREHVARDDI